VRGGEGEVGCLFPASFLYKDLRGVRILISERPPFIASRVHHGGVAQEIRCYRNGFHTNKDRFIPSFTSV